MKNKMLTAILSLMLISALLTIGCSDGGPAQISLGTITGCAECSGQPPQIGEPATDFQFQTPEGELTSLSDSRGQPVLLNFWATWCSPCRMEMPYLQQIYDEWQGEGLVLLAINIGESADEATSFLESRSITFPVLLDTNYDVAICYYTISIPMTFFIDEDGIIQYIKVGPFTSLGEIENIVSQLITD
ncbi:MAG TPA: TlpA family protein disulfide reductase [Dehalococcoidia bacterium]|nr:TlpA family protein disulfide reductase [Dehalococcoidia bacterium]